MLPLLLLGILQIQSVQEPSDLYWVELQDVRLSYCGDPAGAGEVSILMAIGPGQMALMTQGSSDTVSAYTNHTTKVAGERLYLPQHWITNQTVTLYFMIRERDDHLPDDILVPPRRITVELNEQLFQEHKGFHRVDLVEDAFKTEDGYETRKTSLGLHFFRKKAKDCLFRGADPDRFFSKENERTLYLQELRFLGTSQLIGGVERRQLQSNVAADAKPQDIEVIHKRNFRALLRYREWLHVFGDQPESAEIKSLFRSKIQEINKRGIRVGDKQGKLFPAFTEQDLNLLLQPL